MATRHKALTSGLMFSNLNKKEKGKRQYSNDSYLYFVRYDCLMRREKYEMGELLIFPYSGKKIGLRMQLKVS